MSLGERKAKVRTPGKKKGREKARACFPQGECTATKQILKQNNIKIVEFYF